MQAGEEGGGGGGQLETVSQGCQHTQAPLALDSHSSGKLHISNISTLVPSLQCTLHCGCVEVHISRISTVHTATHCIIALQSWTNVGTRWNKSRTKRRQSGLCQSLTSKKSTCQLVNLSRNDDCAQLPEHIASWRWIVALLQLASTGHLYQIWLFLLICELTYEWSCALNRGCGGNRDSA